MDTADKKALARALFVLKQARTASPRLDIRPPSPEDLESARCVLRRLDGLQLHETLIESPELMLQFLAP